MIIDVIGPVIIYVLRRVGAIAIRAESEGPGCRRGDGMLPDLNFAGYADRVGPTRGNVGRYAEIDGGIVMPRIGGWCWFSFIRITVPCLLRRRSGDGDKNADQSDNPAEY